MYSGDQVEDDEKSLAYSVTFRASDRTLTSEDADRIRAAIVKAASALGARLRA